MDVPLDDFGFLDSLQDTSWLWDEVTLADLPFPTLDGLALLAQARLTVSLSQATSLINWAPEGESEKLILSLEDFVRRAKSLRGDEHLSVESSIEEKGELPVSDQSPTAKVQTKRAKVSLELAAIEWDFQMVDSLFFFFFFFLFLLLFSLCSSQMW